MPEEETRIASPRFFNPFAPIENEVGTLPHWRQDAVTYFVTFRVGDTLPEEKLAAWRTELQQLEVAAASRRVLSAEETAQLRRDAASTLSAKVEHWLDQGAGSCVLQIPECRDIVQSALRHFEGSRYTLGEHVVAANHVHAIIAPHCDVALSDILHSWKSFSSKAILKVPAASRRLCASGHPRMVWQKESFDHIVRSAASLAKFQSYIRQHREYRQG